MEPKRPNKREVIMRTQNPIHEGDIKWFIDNACKFSRRDACKFSNFSPQTNCQPKFQVVAKFNESYPDVHVMNVNIGVQRIDSGDKSVYVTTDAKLLNTDGDIYCHKEYNFNCHSGGAPFYIFSEMFSESADKLTIPKPKTGISSDDIDELFHLRVKNLIAAHGDVGRIFILPNDKLVAQVHIKTYGCCLLTSKVEVPFVPETQSPKSHADQLLSDFQHAFENEILTDIDLVAGDKTVKAHRFVLQTRSPVFKQMFEHNLTETTKGTIQIDDVNYTVLRALLSYLYSATVLKLPYNDLCDLYEAADKYQVSSLQNECAEMLKCFFSVDTVCRILVLADMHNDSLLRQEAVDYISRNFAKVKVTEEWELTIRSHKKVASDVLEKVCNFTPEKKS